MAKFRIDAKEFQEFLSKVHLNGLVFDCVIAVEKGRLVATGLDIAKSIYFHIAKEAKVISAGELVLGNIAVFLKILSRFDGTVEISTDKKLIRVKRKNKIGTFEAVDKKAIDSYSKAGAISVGKDFVKTPTLKLKYKTNRFTLDSQELASLVGDADILDEHIYYIEVDRDKSIRLRVKKGRNTFVTKVTPEKQDIRKAMIACFGHGVKEIFSTVSGEVKIFVEPDPPMLIRFGPKYNSLYLIMTREET